METEGTLEAKGISATVTVSGGKLTITRKGFMSLVLHGLKGEKDIQIADITSVQFKKAGSVISGYIQFGYPGATESKKGIWEAAEDENTVMFVEGNQPDFEAIKDYIDRYREQVRNPGSASASGSDLEELERLAALLDRGILTAEEFEEKKRQILSR